MIPRPFGRQKDPPPNVTEGLEKLLEEASPTYQLDQVQFSHVLHFYRTHFNNNFLHAVGIRLCHRYMEILFVKGSPFFREFRPDAQ